MTKIMVFPILVLCLVLLCCCSTDDWAGSEEVPATSVTMESGGVPVPGTGSAQVLVPNGDSWTASLSGEQTETLADPTLAEHYAFLRTASPWARGSILAGFARSDDPLATARITANKERLLQFLAQSAVETFGWRTLEENLNYSADRLRQVFGRRVTPEDAERLHRQPREIAIHVYGDRLGNRPGTSDGWNYRGSGYLQLTGRTNFIEVDNRLKERILEAPDLVREPRLGLDAALAYWDLRKVSEVADSGNHREVRQKINGGTNGLAEAKVWYAQISETYRAHQQPQTEAGRDRIDPVDVAVAEALAELGMLEGPRLESTFTSSRYSNALKQFQISRGLQPTGVVDTPTLYAITDPLGRFSADE